MQVPPNSASAPPAAATPLPVAADVQDALMSATNDLERLQGLLAHAVNDLMHLFSSVHGQLLDPALAGDDEAVSQRLSGELREAITALQFQDMASQLITHTTRRLRYCADQLAREAMGDDEDGETVVDAPPDRPNPVTQDEMDAGSIELF